MIAASRCVFVKISNGFNFLIAFNSLTRSLMC